MLRDFRQGGQKAIERVRRTQPAAYLKICALLVPREMKLEHTNAIKDLTDEELFQMLGVFAEFERSIIQERVRAGLQRAKREGKRLGRPPIADKLAERIRAALAGGMSVRKTAAKFDVNPSTVQRVAHPFDGAENASVAGAA